jgi:hypothetical protein
MIYPEDVKIKSVTIEGRTFFYYDINKQLYSTESSARYAGSTAGRCKVCGAGFQGKVYTVCPTCRQKQDIDTYYQREDKEVGDGEYMYSDAYDKYFYSWDDVQEFLDEDDDEDLTLEDLRLLCVQPTRKRYIDLSEIYADEIPEDMSAEDVFSPEIIAKVEDINRLLDSQPPISWEPSKFRVKL